MLEKKIDPTARPNQPPPVKQGDLTRLSSNSVPLPTKIVNIVNNYNGTFTIGNNNTSAGPNSIAVGGDIEGDANIAPNEWQQKSIKKSNKLRCRDGYENDFYDKKRDTAINIAVSHLLKIKRFELYYHPPSNLSSGQIRAILW